jgi:hypothetical protein
LNGTTGRSVRVGPFFFVQTGLKEKGPPGPKSVSGNGIMKKSLLETEKKATGMTASMDPAIAQRNCLSVSDKPSD